MLAGTALVVWFCAVAILGVAVIIKEQQAESLTPQDFKMLLW